MELKKYQKLDTTNAFESSNNLQLNKENHSAKGNPMHRSKPSKTNVSPYSWRRKKTSNASLEMEVATLKIMSIMTKARLKRASSIILTFIDMITKNEFDHMIFVCQRQLSKIFNCEEAYIFVKDLKSQLRVITRDQVIKHYHVDELHKIGEVFKSKESIKIGRNRAYLDYEFYHDLVLNKISNGIIVPIIDKSSKASIGIFMVVNKINSNSFNHDEYGMCELVARFLSGVLNTHCIKEKLSEVEYQSFALTKSCYRLFISNDIESCILEAQDICCQILRIECCRVYLLDPVDKESFL